MRISRFQVQVVAASVVAVFAVGIWFSGGEVNPGWLRFFSAAVLLATALLAIWERWLWAIPVVQRTLQVPRDLRGTWRGTLTSFWTNPATGRPPDPKTVYLVIHQSASSVSAVLYSDESVSRSSLAHVAIDSIEPSISYIYLNRPDTRVEHRSRSHNGSVFLAVSGSPANRLRGRYWTDRDTRGELEFCRRSRTRADDYQHAVALLR